MAESETPLTWSRKLTRLLRRQIRRRIPTGTGRMVVNLIDPSRSRPGEQRPAEREIAAMRPLSAGHARETTTSIPPRPVFNNSPTGERESRRIRLEIDHDANRVNFMRGARAITRIAERLAGIPPSRRSRPRQRFSTELSKAWFEANRFILDEVGLGPTDNLSAGNFKCWEHGQTRSVVVERTSGSMVNIQMLDRRQLAMRRGYRNIPIIGEEQDSAEFDLSAFCEHHSLNSCLESPSYYKRRRSGSYHAIGAEMKARALLKRLIGGVEYKRYLKNGFVNFSGKDGYIYQVYPGEMFTRVWYEGKEDAGLCVVFSRRGHMNPPTDSLVMRLLLLQDGEYTFRGHCEAVFGGRPVQLRDPPEILPGRILRIKKAKSAGLIDVVKGRIVEPKEKVRIDAKC